MLSFAVGRGDQTITFDPLPTTGTIGDVPTLAATSSSGLPVAFSLDGTTTGGACDLVGTT